MILTILITGLSTLILLGIRYMFSIWAGGSVQELVFTMTGNLDGVNSDMILQGLLQIALPVVILIAIYVFLMKKWILPKGSRWFHTCNGILAGLSLLGAIFSIHHAWTTLDVTSYLAEQGLIEIHSVGTLAKDAHDELASAAIAEALKYADADEQQLLAIQKKRLEMSFIDANFVDPKEVEIAAPSEKRNLILIFLESMETTYSDEKDGGAFDYDYIPELTAIAEENEDFGGTDPGLNGAQVLSYSTWTMGGIFAHTAGLPLNIPVGRNQMDSQDVFLPGVTTLGDILQSYGYQQAFQCGSDVSFGGRKAYFRTHGDYDLYDIRYAWDNGYVQNGRVVFWGYEDKYLFTIAKDKITEMAASGEPFNYTMLTVDTHYPDGYLCDLCGDDLTFTTSSGYRTPYGNAMRCSSHQVSEFINWIQQQDFYENTTIVLLGDHLTMDKNFCSDISSDYTRRTYVTYINSAVEPELDTPREYATEDSFPTILASMGFKIAGNKLALGTNLFSSVPTLMEEYGYRAMDAGITAPSDYMTAITSDVDIDAASAMYNIYHAEISTEADPDREGVHNIIVSDVTSDTGIGKISLALSAHDDESDTIWVTAYKQPDDTYKATIYDSQFSYDPEGTIKIEAYVYDWSWVSHFLNRTYLELGDGASAGAGSTE